MNSQMNVNLNKCHRMLTKRIGVSDVSHKSTKPTTDLTSNGGVEGLRV